MTIKSALLTLTALCTLTVTAEATSIVAIKTGNDIFIGTDSKVLIEKDVAISQCKITKMNDIYLVFSGIPALPASSFNAYTIAEQAFAGQGSIADRLTAYDKAVSGKLQEAFEKLRTSDAKLFSRWYTEDVQNRVAMQVLVAGAEQAGTTMAILEYRIESKQNEPVKLKSYRDTMDKKTSLSKPAILILGTQDGINVLKKSKNFLNDFDEVSKINEWILAEAKASPSKVSAPVDILKISPNKAEWLQHKAQCPEIEAPAKPVNHGKK
jgi:hypothetical protein